MQSPCRVWAPRGVKARQAVELAYDWRYLALAVDGVQGQVWWAWMPNMQQASLQQVVREWRAAGIDAVVWDGAPSHRAKTVQEVGVTLVRQPPASPELNPAEREFEELRRAVEGRVYGTLAAKMAKVEQELTALAAEPERVRQLTGWGWIQEALPQRPPEFTVFS